MLAAKKISLHNLVGSAPVNQAVTVTMPVVELHLQLILEEITTVLTPVCDTVVINSDDQVLQMIWRVSIPWQRNDQRQGIILLQELSA